MQADAAALPFGDGTFRAVAALWISTDVDDFTAVLAEAARVLSPGGRVVFYGAHPCFNGPHTQWMDDGGILAHPTYRQPGWHPEASWWGPTSASGFSDLPVLALPRGKISFLTAGRRPVVSCPQGVMR